MTESGKDYEAIGSSRGGKLPTPVGGGCRRVDRQAKKGNDFCDEEGEAKQVLRAGLSSGALELWKRHI